MDISVVVNGTPMTLVDGSSLADLLARLEVRGRLAVEIDGELVPKSSHATRLLKAHERIEIVQAIGGG